MRNEDRDYHNANCRNYTLAIVGALMTLMIVCAGGVAWMI